MAKAVVSVKTKNVPKAPKIGASKSAWDNYEKKKKAAIAHNKNAAKEKERRQKIKATK